LNMINKINLNNIIMSLIPMSYFVWSADFTGAVLVLLGLCILDLFTGIRKAQKLGELSSRVAIRKSVEKAFNYGTFLIVGYLVNMFVLSLEPTGYLATLVISLFGNIIEYLFIGFVGFLIGVEGYSILENLAAMGMPVPQKLINRWSKNIK
ncbi:MAG TPA: phage holin family protein, partial [Candidatus Syntrophosphaera thermopropionivorans]|nr:phage holin family protein [Candidatus Syntrophosphaera thermopropionivorans]